jgi:hypothetical protein
MNTKEAKLLLSQVQKSGLHLKNAHAKELVEELTKYLKNAGQKKKASSLEFISNDAFGKPTFVYWATAALLKLQADGVEELQGMAIPTPNDGEQPDAFGNRVLRSSPRGIRRPRRRTANVSYSEYVSSLWDKISPQLKSRIKLVRKKFFGFYMGSKRKEAEYDVEEWWSRASMWALALSGHNDLSKGDRQRGIQQRTLPFNRIASSTPNTGDVAKDVYTGINEGLFSIVLSANRWLTKSEKEQRELGRVDYETGYTDLDDNGAEIGGYANKNLDETGRSTIVNPEEAATNKESLEKYKEKYLAGEYDLDPVAKKGVRSILLEEGLLTLTEEEGLDLKKKYLDGEYSSNLDAEEKIFNLLVSEGWIVEHIDITDNATKAVDVVQQAASNEAKQTVSTMSFPEHGELTKVISELSELGLTIYAMQKISALLDREDFHWLYDAQLYLEEDWVQLVREFDPVAMALLQQTIQTHQQPMIAVGLRYLLSGNAFGDKSKMEKIKEFADNCMDQKLLKSQVISLGVTSWYISCAISINGGLSYECDGETQRLKVGMFNGVPDPAIWHSIVPNIYKMTKAEINGLKSSLKSLVEPLIPSIHPLDKKLDKWISLCAKHSSSTPNPGAARKECLGGAQKDKMKGFFGHIASELIRYRFYLDLGVDSKDTSDPTQPKTLGDKVCDDRVRFLMGRIPTNKVNEIKTELFEELLAPEWAESVQAEIEKRVKVLENQQGKLGKQVTAVFKELGIEKGDPLYDAFVESI